MKNLFATCAICVMALGFASCDNRPDIVGSWQGNVTGVAPQVANSDALMTLTFERDGNATINYLLSSTYSLGATDSIAEAFEASFAATASCQGAWQYVQGEDDEIAIAFDPTTLMVAIEPDQIQFQTGMLTAEQESQLQPLKLAMAESLETQLEQSLAASLQSGMILDDVKVQKPLLKYEINDQDFVLKSVEQ